ncbi:MAG: hypothetical protein AB1715_12470 [Acidobacteriota bacterium]
MARKTIRVSGRKTPKRGVSLLVPILILLAVFTSIPLFVLLILFSLLLVWQSRGGPLENNGVFSRSLARPLLRSPPF